jgi:hypothetical protein
MAVKKVKEVKKGKKFRWRGFEEEQDRRESISAEYLVWRSICRSRCRNRWREYSVEESKWR